MRSVLISLALVCLFTMSMTAGTMAADSRQADEAAIKDRLQAFQSAWNKDDAAAMAAVWTDDGTLINPFGVVAQGRDAIMKVFVEEHAHPFKGTRYEFSDVKFQWLSPDMAIVDLSGNISGIHRQDGSAAPDYPHHVTWVLVKKGDQWMGVAARAYQFGSKPGENK